MTRTSGQAKPEVQDPGPGSLVIAACAALARFPGPRLHI
jgi:hypothetical protein